MDTCKSKRRRPEFPASLTDLHRLGKNIHGHDGSSRIVMVRKTDQRTFTSIQNGQEPKLETITRETIETFRGQRTECKFTTEKKDCQNQLPNEFVYKLEQIKNTNGVKKRSPIMEFQQQCLAAHNEYRQRHGVAPLKLNKEICAVSQNWANTLIKRHSLEHSRNDKYGENIYCVTSSSPNFAPKGSDAVKSWYDEVKVHAFGVEPKYLSSGHFTQVVWRESTEIGVAFAKTNGRYIVVANYFPAGNVVGCFTKNVPPLGGFKTETTNGLTPKLSNLTLKSTQSNFEIDFLNAHNEYRQRHGVPPLKLDRKLSKYSTEWAQILSNKNNLEHRKNCSYGENIFCMYSTDPNFTLTGRAPVDQWYQEIKDHPFGREPHNLKSGHFTQLVWRTSELLGVGVAKSRQGRIYVVANYNPAGNFLGHFGENVPPLLSPRDDVVKSPERRVRLSPESTFDQFSLDMLKVHNEYRRKHGVPELKLNKEVCSLATEWAEHCSKSASIAHRPNNSYGENIFYMYSSDFSHVPLAKDVVKTWYDEVKDHVFGTESTKFSTLHFTQVVWRSTAELGVGMAKNSKGQTYVVANYSPRGNILSQFTANVPKAKF
ncbi:hypothetical protein PPYR_14525 [Photinus pyralis]|uniref:SCP domain-containing protein n=1 Tax=Photinus pyralis TaxID=7054 RepID=A0A5N4A5F2_PHOPY|nr:hypothetical protein PPYR_14525 [Photinus pyralis]